MHRIRGQNEYLYRQRITSPGPGSTFTSWTLTLTELDGPLAIAARGDRIYIFYRADDNTIKKFYSHNGGTNWTAGTVQAYGDVLGLAAVWWGSTSTVICLALKANELRAFRIDTDTQATTTSTATYAAPHTHILNNTYGIGATYDGFWPQVNIIFAGRQVDTPYNHHNLFRTALSDTWHYAGLESIASAPDGEDLLFKHPSVHRPAVPTAYESDRVIYLEDFAGLTAYTRPMACHIMPGTTWSDATVTEPAPFMDLAPAYGMRIQTTDDYWWLCTQNGVWQAARVMPAPLEVSGDIVSFQVNRPGLIVLELDNSKAQYATPGAAGLSSLRWRSEVELRFGYRVPVLGNVTVPAATAWVDSWEYASDPNISRFTIQCIDGWGLLRSWTPRYQMRWNATAVSPRSVWMVLARLLARAGLYLTTTPTQPHSPTIDGFYPDFTLTPGTRGDTAVRRLLSMVPDQLLFLPHGQAQTKDPRPTETPTWQYGPGDNIVLAGRYGQAVIPSRARVLGRDAGGNRLLHDEIDWAALGDGIDILDQVYDPNLDTAVRTYERALAITRRRALESHPAAITAPTNVFLILQDILEITDPRCGISARRYRVLADRVDFQRRHLRYHHTMMLGAP